MTSVQQMKSHSSVLRRRSRNSRTARRRRSRNSPDAPRRRRRRSMHKSPKRRYRGEMINILKQEPFTNAPTYSHVFFNITVDPTQDDAVQIIRDILASLVTPELANKVYMFQIEITSLGSLASNRKVATKMVLEILMAIDRLHIVGRVSGLVFYAPTVPWTVMAVIKPIISVVSRKYEKLTPYYGTPFPFRVFCTKESCIVKTKPIGVENVTPESIYDHITKNTDTIPDPQSLDLARLIWPQYKPEFKPEDYERLFLNPRSETLRNMGAEDQNEAAVRGLVIGGE